jgi:adenosylcobinamide-GDP ribazoletransferase
MLRSLKIAVVFLTPVRLHIDPVPQMPEIGRASWAFPLVGAVMGLALVAALLGLSAFLPSSVTAVLVVGLWIFLTGGLHLDGWADCCDALPAAVSPARRREILKDSRVGAFGVVGLFLLLALKVTAAAQSHLPVEALFCAPMIGRGLMVVCATRMPQTGDGMGAQFADGLEPPIIALAAAFGLLPAVIAGWNGMLAVGVALICVFLFTRLAERRFGAINGDVLGAVCELAETLALIAFTVKW